LTFLSRMGKWIVVQDLVEVDVKTINNAVFWHAACKPRVGRCERWRTPIRCLVHVSQLMRCTPPGWSSQPAFSAVL